MGKYRSCKSFGWIGGTTKFGDFSETIVVGEDMLHKLPPEIALDYADVIELLTIVWHAIKVSAIVEWKEQSVLVLDGGRIGFALLLCV